MAILLNRAYKLIQRQQGSGSYRSDCEKNVVVIATCGLGLPEDSGFYDFEMARNTIHRFPAFF
jgi:hypothetical protein